MRIDGNQHVRLHQGHGARDSVKDKLLQGTKAPAPGAVRNGSETQQSESAKQLIGQLQEIADVRAERVSDVKKRLQEGLYDGPMAAARTADAIVSALEKS